MKPKRRIVGFLLALCLVAGLLPTTAFAEETDTGKAIQLGTGGISGYDSTDGYDYIYFGNWTSQDSYTTSGPIKWRVLDDQTNTGETGLFLLSDALLGTGQYGGVVFDNSGNNSNAWQNSTAQAWCKDFAGEAGAAENVPDAFTAAELAAILATTKSDGAYRSSTYNYNYSASENILNGDRVFFLSAEEAEKSSYGLTETSDRQAYHGTERGMWWLRSPYASNASKAGVVTYAGNVDQFPVTNLYAARPAFNLGTDAVLFTSAAASGKEDAAVDGNLTAVGAGSNSWKLTLKDTSRSFTVTETAAAGKSGETITLNYSNAKTGTNEYVSILLVNDSDEVLYYGHIANNSESGTASVEIPTGLAEGTYTLKVFSEQCNGDYQTDYASDFEDVTLTVGDTVTGDVAIDETNFPDAKFRTVASGYDKDHSGTLSPEEIAEVIWIDCDNKSIGSLQGIEFFSALERLYCSKNSLTALDVSHNPALKILTCSDNSLTTLDVSSNTALKILGCYNNSLTTLNVSGAAALKELRCYQNDLTTLDVSGNTALELLHCFENSLTSLNVSSNTALKELYCYKNSLTALNVSSLPALETVYCYKNKLTALDASGAAALKELQCYENNLTSLNVSGDTALVKLDCAFNSLTALDVSSNTALEELQCCYNSLTALDVRNNTALVSLNCGANSLTALDISHNTALERLWCYENNLTTLDVSQNTALTMLYCWENSLTSLDVTRLSNLGTYGLDATGNIYNIRDAVGTGRTFDLSTLPGNFDVNKVSSWNGGTVDGNILTIDEDVYTVTYTYDCGEEYSTTFSLTTLQEITSIEATVTAPVIGEGPADSADFVTAPGNAAEFRKLAWYKTDNFSGTYCDVWTEMEEDETFQPGYYYRVKLYFDANEGFGFFKNVTGKVNGRDHDDIFHAVYDYADSSYAYLSIVYGPLHEHVSGDEYAYDENSHWNPCTQCDEKMNIADHTFDWVIDKAATTTEKGLKHEKCTVCDYRKAAVEIPATGSSGGSGTTSGGSSGSTSYSVSVDSVKNGSVSISPKSAGKGDTVTITVTPNAGYTLETLTVTDASGKELTLTEKNGKYTFTMPASRVEIKATFMEDNSMLNFFVDVPAGTYYYDAVLWAAEQGITGGTTATTFSPNAPCTRAQIVTFLWRAAGSPEPKSMNNFADVSADAYYAKAVAWAIEQGITTGTSDTTFSPDATCTRSQAVTFLYRASGSSAVESIPAFSDVASDAYYTDAVAWAAQNGITGGTTATTFSPANNCTRAQIVTFLYRWMVK